MKYIDNTRRLIEMPDLTFLPNRLHRGIAEEGAGKESPYSRNGFTVVEILIVAVILSIVALTVVPMLSSAGSMQLRAASNMIAADLEYAKSMAISRGQNYTVRFDTNAESYQVEDQNNNVVPHPVNKGFNYIMNFQNDSRLNRVNILAVNIGGTDNVTFDSLGSPDSGGAVILQVSGTNVTIMVEPITGYISIQ